MFFFDKRAPATRRQLPRAHDLTLGSAIENAHADDRIGTSRWAATRRRSSTRHFSPA
jgi:hypothetical protein